MTLITIDTWKTIDFGDFVIRDEASLKEDCAKLGYGVSNWLNPFIFNGINNFTPEASDSTVDLVRVSGIELGLCDSTKISDVLYLAEENNLKLCSIATAVQLRRKYLDQALDEVLYVGMSPIISVEAIQVSCVLKVKENNSIPVLGYHAFRDFNVNPQDLFIFSI